MPANRTQTNAQDQEQRELVRSMEQTQREVILPSLKSLQVDVKTFVQKDYLTKAEADGKYMTKADFRPYAVALGTIATIALGVIVTAVLRGILK